MPDLAKIKWCIPKLLPLFLYGHKRRSHYRICHCVCNDDISGTPQKRKLYISHHASHPINILPNKKHMIVIIYILALQRMDCRYHHGSAAYTWITYRNPTIFLNRFLAVPHCHFRHKLANIIRCKKLPFPMVPQL